MEIISLVVIAWQRLPYPREGLVLLLERTLKELKEGISEKKKGPKFKRTGSTEEEPTEIDMQKVENIVKRMKEKYKEEGVEFDKVGGPLSDLRGLIAEGMAAKIEIQTVEELKEFKSKLVQFLANFYIKAGAILKPIAENMRKFPEMEMLVQPSTSPAADLLGSPRY